MSGPDREARLSVIAQSDIMAAFYAKNAGCWQAKKFALSREMEAGTGARGEAGESAGTVFPQGLPRVAARKRLLPEAEHDTLLELWFA